MVGILSVQRERYIEYMCLSREKKEFFCCVALLKRFKAVAFC